MPRNPYGFEYGIGIKNATAQLWSILRSRIDKNHFEILRETICQLSDEHLDAKETLSVQTDGTATIRHSLQKLFPDIFSGNDMNQRLNYSLHIAYVSHRNARAKLRKKNRLGPHGIVIPPLKQERALRVLDANNPATSAEVPAPQKLRINPRSPPSKVSRRKVEVLVPPVPIAFRRKPRESTPDNSTNDVPPSSPYIPLAAQHPLLSLRTQSKGKKTTGLAWRPKLPINGAKHRARTPSHNMMPIASTSSLISSRDSPRKERNQNMEPRLSPNANTRFLPPTLPSPATNDSFRNTTQASCSTAATAPTSSTLPDRIPAVPTNSNANPPLPTSNPSNTPNASGVRRRFRPCTVDFNTRTSFPSSSPTATLTSSSTVGPGSPPDEHCVSPMSSPSNPGHKGVAAFLDSCIPSMKHLLDRFISFGCNNEEFILSVSRWDDAKIRRFLEEFSMDSEGRRLSKMEIVVLQNHWKDYFGL